MSSLSINIPTQYKIDATYWIVSSITITSTTPGAMVSLTMQGYQSQDQFNNGAKELVSKTVRFTNEHYMTVGTDINLENIKLLLVTELTTESVLANGIEQNPFIGATINQ